MKRVVMLLAGLGFVAQPAAAQKPGSIEVGGFLAYSNADNSLPVGNAVAVGGRAAVHAQPWLSVEFDLARASRNGATHTPLHVWLVYNVPPQARAEFLFGVGYVRNRYRGAYVADDNGIGVIAGARRPFRKMVALRLDAHVDFMPSPQNQSYISSFNGNWDLRVGLSVLLNRPPAP